MAVLAKDTRPLVPIDTAAQILGMSPRTVRRLTERGLLPAVRVPHVRRRLYDPCDIARLIESAKRQS
jgi:excisionase family DNA binding protein